MIFANSHGIFHLIIPNKRHIIQDIHPKYVLEWGGVNRAVNCQAHVLFHTGVNNPNSQLHSQYFFPILCNPLPLFVKTTSCW